MTQLVLNKQN